MAKNKSIPDLRYSFISASDSTSIRGVRSRTFFFSFNLLTVVGDAVLCIFYIDKQVYTRGCRSSCVRACRVSRVCMPSRIDARSRSTYASIESQGTAPFYRADPFLQGEKKKKGHRTKDFHASVRTEEGPSRTRKSTTENYGRRRNSRGVAAVKNCIFSCQKIGGGRRGEGERRERGEKPRRRPVSSFSSFSLLRGTVIPFGSSVRHGAD